MLDEGRHGAMPYATFEEIVRKAAVKDVSFHFENQGARIGLPPDVTTVMFGTPDDGLWYNVRKGEIPEEDIHTLTPRVKTHYEKMMESGLITRVRGRRMYRAGPEFHKTIKHYGWRTVLAGMMSAGLIRETPTLREWLGNNVSDQARYVQKIDNRKLADPLVRGSSGGQPMFMLGSAWKG